MASRRREQQETARFRVMRLLENNPKLSSRKIAKLIGISHGSAYYVLRALLDKGFVKLENFTNNPNKGSYTYLLTAKGIHEKSYLTHRFINRKRKEFEELRMEKESLEKEADLAVFKNQLES